MGDGGVDGVPYMCRSLIFARINMQKAYENGNMSMRIQQACERTNGRASE